MHLNIDGAGRSRSLACLPTARGTLIKSIPGGLFLCERISGPAGLRARRRGQKQDRLQVGPLEASKTSRGLQGPSGTSRSQPPGHSRGSRGLHASGALQGSRNRGASFENLQRVLGLQPSNNLQAPHSTATGRLLGLLITFSASQKSQRTQMKTCCC